MPRISIEDLDWISEKIRRTTLLREGAGRARITVHMGTCGIAAGARKIVDTLLAEMEEKDVKDVILTTSGCAGLCSKEPMATVELKGEAPVKYIELTPEKIAHLGKLHGSRFLNIFNHENVIPHLSFNNVRPLSFFHGKNHHFYLRQSLTLYEISHISPALSKRPL